MADIEDYDSRTLKIGLNKNNSNRCHTCGAEIKDGWAASCFSCNEAFCSYHYDIVGNTIYCLDCLGKDDTSKVKMFLYKLKKIIIKIATIGKVEALLLILFFVLLYIGTSSNRILSLIAIYFAGIIFGASLKDIIKRRKNDK